VSGLVLDCSVTIAWCLKDHPEPYAEKVLDALRETEALVPALWQLEVVNVLLMAEKRGRVERPVALRFLGDLHELPITVEPTHEASSMEDLLRLAARRGLTAYDAAYLDVALRRGMAIATLDDALRKACRAAGVPLFTP